MNTGDNIHVWCTFRIPNRCIVRTIHSESRTLPSRTQRMCSKKWVHTKCMYLCTGSVGKVNPTGSLPGMPPVAACFRWVGWQRNKSGIARLALATDYSTVAVPRKRNTVLLETWFKQRKNCDSLEKAASSRKIFGTDNIIKIWKFFKKDIPRVGMEGTFAGNSRSLSAFTPFWSLPSPSSCEPRPPAPGYRHTARPHRLLLQHCSRRQAPPIGEWKRGSMMNELFCTHKNPQKENGFSARWTECF